ncbi:hypothetical protein ACGFYZ_40340 [Streptomyces sp. NPDC048330]|uniref:hypothetical protein n=1 Tax=Streptomyces sp. NPDC048330 TaxID=3365533 RepID=UPI00371A5B8C
MTASCTTAELRDTVTMLSSPPLIRLITEIDDNGPIPPRGLASTLADLSTHQLRQTADLARTLGLIHVRPGTGLGLTEAGTELADVYDATARWARCHAYPSGISDFTTRVQHTLRLMTETLAPDTADGPRCQTGDHLPSAEWDADFVRACDLLRHWLSAYQQAACLAESEPAA